MTVRTALASISFAAASLLCPAMSVPVAAQTAPASLASGTVEGGNVTAEVSAAVKTGNRLTVKVRFVEVPGAKGRGNTLYSSISKGSYEKEFYLLAGEKKYLLLKDSAGNPLTPPGFSLANEGKVRGNWYGIFPAPPAGESLMLFLPHVEPLGPFTASGE